MQGVHKSYADRTADPSDVDSPRHWPRRKEGEATQKLSLIPSGFDAMPEAHCAAALSLQLLTIFKNHSYL